MIIQRPKPPFLSYLHSAKSRNVERQSPNAQQWHCGLYGRYYTWEEIRLKMRPQGQATDGAGRYREDEVVPTQEPKGNRKPSQPPFIFIS